MNTACGSRDFLRGFRLSLIVEGLATSTIDHYYRDTSRFCDYLGDRPPSSINSGDVISYLAEFGATRSAKTTREAQLAIRRFFRFLYVEGSVGADPTHGLKLPTCRVEPQPTYSEAEVKRLLLVCKGKSLDSDTSDSWGSTRAVRSLHRLSGTSSSPGMLDAGARGLAESLGHRRFPGLHFL